MHFPTMQIESEGGVKIWVGNMWADSWAFDFSMFTESALTQSSPLYKFL